MLCGFHCYKNLELMIRAITTNNIIERLKHLTNLTNPAYFFKTHDRIVSFIEESDNSYYVNDEDKKKLRSKNNPLERNMLRYLLMYDPMVQELKKNDRNVKIYIRPFLMGFGLMQLTIEQVKEL
jgi:ABC-type bacteriocin/lantibiotic exporter with double-glycine peptidase domain